MRRERVRVSERKRRWARKRDKEERKMTVKVHRYSSPVLFPGKNGSLRKRGKLWVEGRRKREGELSRSHMASTNWGLLIF